MEKLEKITSTLLDGLSPKQKEVLIKRFGLNGKEPLTLAELGEKYGVTRERIRQIELVALGVVRENIERGDSKDLLARIAKRLESAGGLRRNDLLVTDLSLPIDQENHLMFLMEASARFDYHREDDTFYSFWSEDKKVFKLADGFISKFAKFISSKKENVITHGKFDELIAKVASENNLKVDTALNYLLISKKFSRNAYGDFGLTSWPEINPKTMRDRSYLVLKKKAAPLHFREIAKLINETNFDEKKAHPSTVHNELIKDERFVLVGRGMYGLSEHGYQSGTAKEVIKRILKKHGPLKPDQVVTLVKQERFLKEGTILLNLQNKKHFKRLDTGSYHVNEA